MVYEISEPQAWGLGVACVMMCADVLTGFLSACVRECVSSSKMRRGLLHKCLMLVVILASLVIEVGLSHMVALPYDVPTCEVVCGYVIVMELMSVLENVAEGYPEMRDSPLFRLFGYGKEGDSDDDA